MTFMTWKWNCENWVLIYNKKMVPLNLWVCIWSKTLRQDLNRWNILGLFNVLLRQSSWMIACQMVNLCFKKLIPCSRMRMVNQQVGCSSTVVVYVCSYICLDILVQMLPFLWIFVPGTYLFLNSIINWHWRSWRVTLIRQRIVVWYWILIMMCVKWTHTQMPIFLGCMDMRILIILNVLRYLPDLSSGLWIVLFCGFQSYKPRLIYRLWRHK